MLSGNSDHSEIGVKDPSRTLGNSSVEQVWVTLHRLGPELGFFSPGVRVGTEASETMTLDNSTLTHPSFTTESRTERNSFGIFPFRLRYFVCTKERLPFVKFGSRGGPREFTQKCLK